MMGRIVARRLARKLANGQTKLLAVRKHPYRFVGECKYNFTLEWQWLARRPGRGRKVVIKKVKVLKPRLRRKRRLRWDIACYDPWAKADGSWHRVGCKAKFGPAAVDGKDADHNNGRAEEGTTKGWRSLSWEKLRPKTRSRSDPDAKKVGKR